MTGQRATATVGAADFWPIRLNRLRRFRRVSQVRRFSRLNRLNRVSRLSRFICTPGGRDVSSKSWIHPQESPVTARENWGPVPGNRLPISTSLIHFNIANALNSLALAGRA